jgi:glycosyltransferase involved in cell wall biosynthesis
LAAEVKKSILYRGRKPDVVSNGIDTIDIFQRRPKTQCKIALGFDPNIRLIVLMAGNLNDLNKGFYWAVQTLEHLPAEIKAGFRILCIGTPPQEAGDQLAGFDVSWAGYVQDQRLLSIMLNASDLMLYPSMADNQPLAVIEALACGTPVFAFRTGGIPEIIPGNSGVVTPRKDCKALAHAISEAIKNDRLSSMSDAARAYAETHLSRERMAASYLELYRLVLRNE